MFEKNLQDLVKGIRSSNNDSGYIAKAIQEIKEELKSRDVTIKAQALQKLTYVSCARDARCGSEGG
jgi:AP-3 complex subunit delta-1